jgi:hypothetical protein
MDTSKLLGAKPIQGRQRPRRKVRKITTAAMLAARVTANPVLWIGTRDGE